jgi:hypothetical protein
MSDQSLLIATQLLPKKEWAQSSQGSDFSSHSWYENDDYDHLSIHTSFNDATMDLLKYGTCTDLLGLALSKLHNLSEFQIQPPSFEEAARDTKRTEPVSRWTVALQVPLPIVFLKAPRLQKLSIEPSSSYGSTDIAAKPTISKVLGFFTKQLASLQKLRLNLAFDGNEGEQADTQI